MVLKHLSCIAVRKLTSSLPEEYREPHSWELPRPVFNKGPYFVATFTTCVYLHSIAFVSDVWQHLEETFYYKSSSIMRIGNGLVLLVTIRQVLHHSLLKQNFESNLHHHLQ